MQRKRTIALALTLFFTAAVPVYVWADCAPFSGVSASDSLPPEFRVPDIHKQESNAIDSILKIQDEKNRQFYDSLKYRNLFSRMFHKYLVRRTPSASSQKFRLPVDQARLFREYEGKTIADIEIVANNIFVNPTNDLQNWTNRLHTPSMKRTIRRDLLFRTGDRIDPDLLVKNNQLLRSRSYIYRSEIVVTPVDGDTTRVNVKVITSDTWSIGADGNARGLTGEVWGGLYDFNFLGTGNKLRYQLSLDWKGGGYKGSLVEYRIPNILGTFWLGNFTAGRSFYNTQYSAAMNKRFILDGDYEIGAEFMNRSTNYYLLRYDNNGTTLWDLNDIRVKYTSLDLWGGKSVAFKDAGYSLYGMARYHYINYYSIDDRLVVGPGINPYFHDGMLYLVSAGIYRERFLVADMIYGYGYNEYIATGYKFELTGGYLDGEFSSGNYVGLNAKLGRFTHNAGYWMGDISLGGFYSGEQNKIFRSALRLRVDYFTKMLSVGKYHFRKFASIDYVQGFNREDGAEEWLRFTTASGPRMIPWRDFEAIGRNRTVFSSETVVFTPWRPLGFRMALFSYADVGFIGDNANIFRNNLYATVGIGVRMKNEMLVFSAIQLTFYVAINKYGLMDNIDWVRLGSERRMRNIRYLPEKPDIVPYQ